MKRNQLTIAVASLLLASSSGVAFAQTTPQTTPQTTTPTTQQYTNNNDQNNQWANNNRVKKEIKQALRSHDVTPTDVRISFNNGTATLRGTVFTHNDIAKAKQAAKGVQGVKRVDTSNLRAQSRQTASSSRHGSQSTMGNNMSNNNMPNRQVAQEIKQELSSHGIAATNVNVSFSNGTATLSGTVANQSDVSKAKQDAMRVHGVEHVNASNLRTRATPQRPF